MENKQLGLVFAAVVALLPIFFTIGFFLGRNTGQATAIEEPGLNQTVTAEDSAGGTGAKQARSVGDSPQALSRTTFLQVAALSQANAEALRKTLVKNGFQVRLLPIPEENLVRALVGPVHNHQELNATREALKALGFESFPSRYH